MKRILLAMALALVFGVTASLGDAAYPYPNIVDSGHIGDC
jgi:hypothetical protein